MITIGNYTKLNISNKLLGIVCLGFIALLSSCKDDPKPDIFFEGDPIPGLKFYYPPKAYAYNDRSAKLSPDGTKLAFVNTNVASTDAPKPFGLYLFYLKTKKFKLVKELCFSPDWSPDGARLVFNYARSLMSLGNIYEADSSGNNVKQVSASIGGGPVAYSPDGKKIGFLNANATLDNQNTFGVYENGNVNFYDMQAGFYDWNPARDEVIGIVRNDKPFFRTFKSIGGTPLEDIIPPQDSNPNDLQYSPDGTRLVYSNFQGVWVMNSDGTNAKRILPSYLFSNNRKPFRLHCASPSWHPDGKHIVYEHFTIINPHLEPISNINVTEGYLEYYIVDVEKALSVSNL